MKPSETYDRKNKMSEQRNVIEFLIPACKSELQMINKWIKYNPAGGGFQGKPAKTTTAAYRLRAEG